MAKEDQKRVFGSLPLVVAVVFIAGAVVLNQLPLQSVRPEPPEGWQSPKPELDKIKARLWQDPFKVAQDHEKAAHPAHEGEPNGCGSPHCINQITTRLRTALFSRRPDVNTPPPVLQMLMIMVRHGESAEDYERRLRNRYAVLSALDAAGMAPEDTQYIRYFRLGPQEDWTDTAQPLLVPFELFERETLYPEGRGSRRPKTVIVVWLAEGAFSDAPLARVAKVLRLMLGAGTPIDLREYLKGNWPALRVDLIAPSSSTTLRAMLGELSTSQARDELRPDLNDVTIFSPWSTASPALLTSTLNGKPSSTAAPVGDLADMFDLIRARFAEADISFVRMIGTDDLLALHLLQELRRRHIDIRPGDGDHIAMISEWDTFYGKAFPLTFATMMECLGPQGTAPDWGEYTTHLRRKTPHYPHCLPSNLHTYTYLSGIDGRLPPAANADTKTKASSDEQGLTRWTYSESLEVPIGRGQLDYARRLAAQLKAQYRASGNHGLRAIGVVGSDVYDKMILLHALREEFGDITLFTTDLDARLMHHERSRWTRNVIVASNFGLGLNPKYQCGIYQAQRFDNDLHNKQLQPSPFAPFRDNYQTALFLACRAALHLTETVKGKETAFRDFDQHLLAETLGHPRLFEIGRGQAVDLSVTKGTPDVNVHPTLLRFRPEFPKTLFRVLLYLGVTAVLLCPVFYLMRGPWSQRPKDRVTIADRLRRALRLAPAVLAVVAFVTIVLADHDKRASGEPFSLSTGTSAWPGLALRLLGFLIGVALFLKARALLARNDQAVASEFELPTSVVIENQHEEGWKGCGRRLQRHVRRWTRRALHLWVAKPKNKRSDRESETVVASELWQERFLCRFVGRDFLAPVLWFVLLWFFPIILGPGVGWPHSPCRGDLCYAAFLVIGLLFYTTLLALLVQVVNATWRRMAVVNTLISRHTLWTAKTYSDLLTPGDADQPHEYVADWLDIRFIARTTEGVNRVLYYPSLVLFFSIAARMSYFDNWGYPPLVLITYCVPFVYLIGLEIALQLGARRARAGALRRMRDQLHQAQYGNQNNQDKAQRIRRMMTEITELREGAFRPFADNPILHALLIPSGGAGLLAVLTYFLPA